ELKRLLWARPNYAIWDDHDYGPDNSNLSFDLKYYTRKIFKEYWGNKTFGDEIDGGIYSRFSWSDADFFLMDNRFFRSANDIPPQVNGQNNRNKHYLGDKQMDWLKNGLISSDKSVKFIVGGGQWLNELNPYESFTNYAFEFDELINFIKDNQIEGVVFLSGDRHFSEIIKFQKGNIYPLYDITSSPLTSGVLNDLGRELNNPARVSGTALTENNFIKVSVSGKSDQRMINVDAIDKDGRIKWSYKILVSDLHY
ncbi:MAG: alkaline phosphatase family protein, partial [Bacteroidia bacterium]|nr:alkaline phosphatase family protein [Bacteroidia bacterium]